MQDLASISENVETQKKKRAEYAGYSLGHWPMWANWALVAVKVRETEDKAQGCPKMGL